MHRLLSGLMVLVAAAATGNSAAESVRVYLGTFADGIYTFTLDTESGEPGAVALAVAAERPGFLALHPDRPLLYAAGQNDEGSAVLAFGRDTSTGMLTLINGASSEGRGACHVDVSPQGAHVAVANYSAGTMAVIPIRSDGGVESASATDAYAGSGPNEKRQQAPGTRMPDVLATLAGAEREQALDELVHFLASLDGPFDATPTPLSAHSLERGRQLYHSIGCVACHESHEEADDLELPLWEFAAGDEVPNSARTSRSLAHLPAKTNATELAAFLLEPHAVIADGRMPNMRLSPDEARDLATYLTTAEVLEGRLDLDFGPGLAFRYIEGEPGDDLDNYTSAEPVATGTWDQLDELPERAEDYFGFLFEGFVELPSDGLWTFATTSDDGSMLWIDGELAVDNGGDHGMRRKEGELDLAAGRHALTITYYERSGGDGLEVEWSGPGTETEVIPAEALRHWVVSARAGDEAFAPDPQLVERGRRRFGELGCVACHPLDGIHARATQAAPALADLGASGGCLDARGRSAAPRYALGAHQRAELAVFIADSDRTVEPSARDDLDRTLTRLDCYACHARDGQGGPNDRTRAYFVGEEGVDLGNEGRFPPHLEQVGWKLKTEWLDDFLVNGGEVRPYLQARMPLFGEEHVGELAELFAGVDRDELEAFFDDLEQPLPKELPRRPEDVEVGARLAGTTGLGCVQCHVYGQHGSTGIRSVDLTKMTERIDSRWFRQLLLDPKSIGMNSRMPEFLVDGGKSPVTDVFDGDAERQVEALWSALSLGAAMPLPEGLLISNEAFDLIPVDGPRLVSVFMKDVGPRVLLVGSPDRIHYAYDVATSRLVTAWRGEFFNARGTWYERAGALESVGEDAIEFPRGLPFAILADGQPQTGGDWPDDNELTHRTLGRRVDVDGWPTFRYALHDGSAGPAVATIAETIVPELGAAGTSIRRRLEVDVTGDCANLWLRVASGGTLTNIDDRTHRVDGIEVRCSIPLQWMTTLTSSEESLLVSIPEGQTTVEVEYSW